MCILVNILISKSILLAPASTAKTDLGLIIVTVRNIPTYPHYTAHNSYFWKHTEQDSFKSSLINTEKRGGSRCVFCIIISGSVWVSPSVLIINYPRLDWSLSDQDLSQSQLAWMSYLAKECLHSCPVPQ